MTSAMPNSSSSAFGMLEQAKLQFWRSNANLTDEEKQQCFVQAASALPSHAPSQPQHQSMAHQTPRSMPCTTDLTQFTSSGFASMDRSQSSNMARVDSTHPMDHDNMWHSMSQEPSNEYSLYSQASAQSQPMLHSSSQASCGANNSMVEYSLDDYVNNFIEPASSPSLPLSFPPNSHHLNVQLTPQWNSSSESSTSPSTPSTALMTPVTQCSNAMSRQGSYNPDFLNNVSMLRVQSDSSCMMPMLPEHGSFPCAFDDSKPISSHVDGPHFFHLTGPQASGNFLSSSVVSASQSTQVLASSDNDQSYLAEDMRRSTSVSSGESLVSDASAPSSTGSRQSRREREINAQASRKIAPKAIDLNDATDSAPCNAQMARIKSEDGSSKTFGLLTKTPYVRPQHPKIMCPRCNERPEGFRGTHELERHVARAHASTRKGYICIDASEDKTFLANCKHCRNKKVYGAYYNAAAHLRRAHFHPRKRGRKGKNDEKRGGIGGGDDPPMDYLKQNWIREVEVRNNKAIMVYSPESVVEEAPELPKKAAAKPRHNSTTVHYTISDDETSAQTERTKMNCFMAPGRDDDMTYSVDAPLYPVQQPLPSSMSQSPIESNQFMDFGMNMQPEPLYNNAVYGGYGSDMVNDINNFQFDAYAMDQ